MTLRRCVLDRLSPSSLSGFSSRKAKGADKVSLVKELGEVF